jgi:uncharacterized protein (DUF2235 family)
MTSLVICCDGTWDSADQAKDPKTGEICVSNVLKLACRAAKRTAAGAQQIVYYDQGVGTGNALDKLEGGAFGEGLDANINDVYRFLIANYEPGDDIYLFGFSRGAFTARSIGGMIRRCGILRRDKVKSYPEAKALYRSGVRSADPRAQQFRKDNAIEDDTPIRCVGVWDTVGALGIPIGVFKNINAKEYQFHDTALSGAVKFAFHALSVDERRRPFTPTLWDTAPAPGQTVQQAWFAGVHSDVGGGYPEHGLSDDALLWMMDCAKTAGLEFDANVVNALGAGPNPLQDAHNSLSLFFRLEAIDRQVGATPTESFHRSLVQRWRDRKDYRPKPLQPHAKRLDALAAGPLNDVLYPVAG